MAKRVDAKQRIRDEVRRLLREQDSGDRLQASQQVVDKILSSPVWAAADTVFAYVSLPDEIETTKLCDQVLRERKRLGLPRFGEEGLVFYQVMELESLRDDNSMAIRQPSRDLPVLCSTRDPRQPGTLLIITPGRAFTPEGGRLGRGGGFYDAFFSSLRQSHIVYRAIGVAFDEQLREELPLGDNDEMVHGVVTPRASFGLIE
ncbi:MAG: 5-formyltetrahydrofolate cyclo-ligase [Spirochaetaceae bacterium]